MKKIINLIIICAISFGFIIIIKADSISDKDVTLVPSNTYQVGLETNPFNNPKNFLSQSTSAAVQPHYEKNIKNVQRIRNTFFTGDMQTGALVYKHQIPTNNSFSFQGYLYNNTTDNTLNNVFNGITLTDVEPNNFLSAHNLLNGQGNSKSSWQVSMGMKKSRLWYQKTNTMYLTRAGYYQGNLFDNSGSTPIMNTIISAFDNQTRIYTSTLNINYNASSRKLIATLNDNSGTKNASTYIPNQIEKVTLGYINMGETRTNTTTVGIENITGYIPNDPTKVVKTNVIYKNTQGEELGEKSVVSSYPGETISVSGNAEYNFLAPEFKGYTLKKDKKEIVTKAGGELVVTYDFNPQELPVKIIDDEDTTNKLSDGKFKVIPYVPYDVSTDVAQSYIPTNYELSRIENGKGIVNVDVKGEISSEITPIEIHVKHAKRTDKKTYIRNINFIPAPNVVGKFPNNVTQTCYQELVIDLVSNKVLKRTGDLTFPEFLVPKVSGYESDVLKVPETKIDDDTALKSDVEVVYYYLTQLNVPKQLTFKPIMIGSLEYYGVRPTKLDKLDGVLDLIAGNPSLNKWEVSVQADSEYKSAMFNINGKNVAIGESQVVYEIDKHKDEKIVSLLSDKDKDVVSLKVKNDKSEALAGDKQNYTLTWSLRNVPV